ncbi:NAD(P)/FAD-dependent oxidoreductase [Brachybacterium sp. GCM10030268]|uniref:NAD(P)/FAD-dependent oxidoreductase n=1 Tax=Brachybacterium sp. GCM10030268 TaxID=3273382 RepID=UPI003620723C
MRIVVIGAGVIGLSIADALARRGVRDLVVLEAGDHPFEAASGRGLGWVNASNKTPREYFALNAAGLRAHRDRSARSPSPWFTESGTLTTGHYRQGFAERTRHLEQWGYPLHRTRLHEVFRDRGLALPHVADEEAVLYPEEGWLDPALYVRHCLSGLGAGTVRTSSPVRSIAHEANGYTVVTDRERLHADAVVNAAGLGAPAVAAMLGRTLPLTSRPGLVVRVRTGDPVTPLVVMHELLDIRPTGGTTYLLHSDAVDAHLGQADGTAAPPADAVEELLGRASAFHSGFDGADLVAARVGVRPLPRDGMPILGGMAELPGYYEAVMHSGITLGPAIGDLLAECILERSIAPDAPAMFHASRY